MFLKLENAQVSLTSTVETDLRLSTLCCPVAVYRGRLMKNHQSLWLRNSSLNWSHCPGRLCAIRSVLRWNFHTLHSHNHHYMIPTRWTDLSCRRRLKFYIHSNKHWVKLQCIWFPPGSLLTSVGRWRWTWKLWRISGKSLFSFSILRHHHDNDQARQLKLLHRRRCRASLHHRRHRLWKSRKFEVSAGSLKRIKATHVWWRPPR